MKIFRTWQFKLVLVLLFIFFIFHGIRAFDHILTQMESSTL